MPSKAKQDKPETHRLEDLDVREVSVVDKPANDSPFLVVKSLDGKLVFQLKESKHMPGTQNQEGGDILDLLGLGFGSDSNGGAAPDAGAASGDPSVPLEIEKSSFRTAVEQAINTIMQKLTKAATDLGDEPTEDQIGAVDWVAKALAALADKLGEGEGEAIEPGDTISASVLKATNSLMGAAALVKELDEEADTAPDAVPGTLRAVASLLTKAIEDVKKAQKPNANPDDGTVSDHAGANADGSTSVGQPEQLEVFVSKAADGNHMLILKRGAKMKKARLNQLKKAIETLNSILSELQGDEGGDDAGKGKTQKAAAPDIAQQLAKGFEALEGRIGEKITEALKPVNEALETVTKRVDDIDGETSGGNGEGDPEETKVVKNDGAKPGMWDSLFA
jgi:hypothetical protein